MTNNGISIRAATLADAPAIHEIYSYHVRHGLASWELEPPTLEEFQARLTQIIEQGYPYFVAGDLRGRSRVYLRQRLSSSARLSLYRGKFGLCPPGVSPAGSGTSYAGSSH